MLSLSHGSSGPASLKFNEYAMHGRATCNANCLQLRAKKLLRIMYSFFANYARIIQPDIYAVIYYNLLASKH